MPLPDAGTCARPWAPQTPQIKFSWKRSGCDERAQLEKAQMEAGDAFDLARKRLQDRSGISLQSEFLALDGAVKEARNRLKLARKAFEQHIQEHGCGDLTGSGRSTKAD